MHVNNVMQALLILTDNSMVAYIALYGGPRSSLWCGLVLHVFMLCTRMDDSSVRHILGRLNMVDSVFFRHNDKCIPKGYTILRKCSIIFV